jgi:hypothetical protein
MIKRVSKKIPFVLSVLIIAVALQLSSCSPVLYSTVGQNVPMFKEKGEFMLQGGYAESYGNYTDAGGVSVQAAYAVNNNYAITGSYYGLKGLKEQGSYLGSSPSEWDSKGSYLELGGGKYGSFNSKPFAWEAFAGLGLGSITNSQLKTNINMKLIKSFIQPSIGYISKYVDLILTPRIGLVSYTSHTSSFVDPMISQQVDEFFEKNKNTLVFEPGITLRAGIKNVKLQLQYNYSTFKTDLGNEENTPVNKDYFSIGFYILISERYIKVE